MPRKKIQPRELPSLLTELREEGATDIRHHAAGLTGQVVVTWAHSPAEEERYRQELLAWRPLYVLSGVTALVMVAVLGLLVALGG